MTRQAILGDIQKRPGLLDAELAAELKALSTPEDPWQIYSGKTMCTTDFYEGRAVPPISMLWCRLFFS